MITSSISQPIIASATAAVLCVVEAVLPTAVPPWMSDITALAALIFVVFWFTRSMDRTVQALRDSVESGKSYLDTFKLFEVEENQAHERLLHRISEGNHAIEKLGVVLMAVAETQKAILSILRDMQHDRTPE